MAECTIHIICTHVYQTTDKWINTNSSIRICIILSNRNKVLATERVYTQM